MSETPTPTLPKWYKPACIVGLVWNLMGVMAFVMQVTMSDAAMAELPENQQEMFKAMPGWVTVAFAVAVLCGTAGCVALLLRKKVALPLFVVSLVAVFVQNGYLLMNDVLAVMGAQAVVMPLIVVVSLVLLIWLSLTATKNGWIQ